MKYSSPLDLAHDPSRSEVEDKILRVLVATWPDGFELWRTVQSTYGSQDVSFADLLAFDLVHPQIPMSTGKLHHRFDSPIGEQVKLETPSRFSKKKFKNPLDKVRWSFWRLGLIEEGASPMPKSTRPNDDNPWVGRFNDWTEEEVVEVAKRLEQQLPQGGLSVTIGEELFTDGTEVERTYVHSSGQYLFQLSRPTGRMSQRQQVWQKILPDFPSFVQWVMRTSKSALVLPGSEAKAWWDAHAEKGELTVPDEELELFELLGERTPYVWEAERLAGWAAERWGDLHV